MTNLISGGVMSGLMGATSSMKLANTAFGVYQSAKNKHDDATMRRAMGYMTDNMNDATEATEKAKIALAENVQIAREEEQVEQTARLEQVHETKKTEEATSVTQKENENLSEIGDTGTSVEESGIIININSSAKILSDIFGQNNDEEMQATIERLGKKAKAAQVVPQHKYKSNVVKYFK